MAPRNAGDRPSTAPAGTYKPRRHGTLGTGANKRRPQAEIDLGGERAGDERGARDDHAWHHRNRNQRNGEENLFNGGVRKFAQCPIAQAEVDSIVFGYDLDGNDGDLNLEHLEGAAGVHFWGKEGDQARYHMLDPAQTYKRGRTRIIGGPMKTSTIQYEAFGEDKDPRKVGPDAEGYLKKYEGAFGKFSDDPTLHKPFQGKRLYPAAPQTQTVVDDLLLGRDLQDTGMHADKIAESADWFETVDGSAGLPKWNWVDPKHRFTGINAVGTTRLGRKTCKGAPATVTVVDSDVFNNDLDGSKEESKEKNAWMDMLHDSAGKQTTCSKYVSDKHRYDANFQEQNRPGRRVIANAPQNDTVVDSFAFNVYMHDQPCVPGSYEWTDVIKDCAGLGHNRRKDVMIGRYHIDKEHAEGIRAGRRNYGTLHTDCIVTEGSRSSRCSVGRPVIRLEMAEVPIESTTNLELFRPPSRQALTQAKRRQKKRDRQVHRSKGVNDAMHSHEEQPPLRAQSARPFRTTVDSSRRDEWRSQTLSPSPPNKQVGKIGTSIYDRDYHQLPYAAYEDAWHQPPPPWFSHPERSGVHGARHPQKAPKANASDGRSSERRSKTSEPATKPQAHRLPDSLPAPPGKALRRSSSLREATDPTASSGGTSRSSLRTLSSRERQRTHSSRRNVGVSEARRMTLPGPPQDVAASR